MRQQEVMKTSITWSPAAGMNVVSVERREQALTVTADSRQPTFCPECGAQSKSRHSTYWRTLWDLSAQGAPVIVHARLGRWRCRNEQCDRLVFTERVPGLAAPFARRTARLAGIVRLLGHSAGGRPSERLMRRLGMPVSDTTILASLKEHARARSESSAMAAVHVVGVDEMVSRDRAGVYAEAAREGAPRARQIADRFHLLQNFREIVERQLGGYEAAIRDTRINASDNHAASPLPERLDRPSDAVAQTHLIRRERQAVRQQVFDKIRALFEGGSSIGEIARNLGLGRRRVERWVRRIDLPDRNTMASTPSTPAYFGVLLERRWAEGITKVRHLFAEIRHRGYTGSFSHLARFLAPWRSGEPSLQDAEQEEPAPVRVRTLDPMTGRGISPLTAAALCIKPPGQMTARQVANVDALKAASAEFTAMRRLAMRFRGLLRGGTAEGLDAWLIDARASGIYAMQRFAKAIRQDLEAVRNAMSEPWSNGQTEGQINKLKTLKRAMYGRAGVELLRARMMPL
jgi:transposase